VVKILGINRNRLRQRLLGHGIDPGGRTAKLPEFVPAAYAKEPCTGHEFCQ